MKTRAELKMAARENFKNKYWITVGSVVIVSLVVGALAVIPFAGWLATIFVGTPISIGLMSYFVKLSSKEEEVGIGTSFKDGFDSNYGRKLGGVLWQTLWVFLWSLLFIIPGIIKSFSYAMTPYILVDCPEVQATDALKISMRMMKGHKWELFVLNLSFIGWQILSAFTFGLLGIFYVNPYVMATSAEYYRNLLEESIANGVVTTEELGR